MRNNSKEQSGQILLLGIVIMAILMTLSASLWGYTTMQIKAGRQAVTRSQALQIAEAGIDKAIYELNQDSNFSGENGTMFGDGEFTTTVVSLDANNKAISSTGYVPNSTNPQSFFTIRTQITLDLSSVAFNFGVQVGNGGLTMGNNAIVNGNVYSNGNVTGPGVISGDVTVAGGGSPTLDQQCTTNGGNFDFDQNNKSDAAQQFTPTSTNSLTKVSVNIKKTGSPGNATVRILTDNSGEPSKTQVGGNGTINSSNVTTNYGWLDVTFATTPELVSGTPYWLLIDSSGNGSNYYSWAVDSNDSCSNGTGKSSADWNKNPNPTYNAISKDLNFQTFMGGVDTELSGVNVAGSVRAHTMTGCSVGIDAYFDTINTCTVVGASNGGTVDSPPESMPISQAQIDEWKNVATSGGTISGNYTVTGTETMGPKQIDGDLLVGNGTILYLTGPLWVTGTILIDTNGSVIVDNSMGSTGTVIMSTGDMTLENNSIANGNNNPGSYLLLISLSSSENALTLSNNSAGAIYYAANGTVQVSQNAGAYQITGYAINMQNNAEITYQSGLASTTFSNGPGGSWAKVDGTYIIVPSP